MPDGSADFGYYSLYGPFYRPKPQETSKQKVKGKKKKHVTSQVPRQNSFPQKNTQKRKNRISLKCRIMTVVPPNFSTKCLWVEKHTYLPSTLTLSHKTLCLIVIIYGLKQTNAEFQGTTLWLEEKHSNTGPGGTLHTKNRVFLSRGSSHFQARGLRIKKTIFMTVLEAQTYVSGLMRPQI